MNPFGIDQEAIARYFGSGQAAPAAAPAPAPAPVSQADASYWSGAKVANAPTGPVDLGANAFGGPPPPPDLRPPPTPTPAKPKDFDWAVALNSLAGGGSMGDALAAGLPKKPAATAPPPDPLSGQVSSPNEDPSRMMSIAAPTGSAPGAGAPTGGMTYDPRMSEPKPKPSTGGGGGGDFGVGKARKDVYATFPREQGDIQDLASVEKARSDAKAAGMGVIGEDQMAQAARMQEEAENQDRFFTAYGDETNKQLDLVRARQVDTTRLMKDGGTKAAAIIGGLLGGVYQGLNKLSKNPFIDDLNAMISQDIGVQERDIERDIRTVGERKSLLGTMRDVYKDKQLARLQAQNLYYEGFKQQLAAEVAQYDSPAIQARANAAITGVERQQASLKLNDAMQNAARAAAQAAFLRAESQRKFDNYLKFEDMESRRLQALGYDKAPKDGMSPQERFVAMGQDPTTGEAVGFLASNGTEATKTRAQNKSMMEIDALANRVLAVRAEQTAVGRALNNQGMYGVVTPEWQTQVRSLEKQLVGAIKEAQSLGALDNGVERFATPITGNLDSIGGSADERLKELIATNQMRREMLAGSIAGPRARSNGAQIRVDGTGVYATPTNQYGSQGVHREAP